MAAFSNKLCIITTISGSIKSFYQGQIEALNRAGIKTTVICQNDNELRSLLPEGTDYIPVSFTRTMTPLLDIKALLELYFIFRKNRFDIVQYSTIKAALLGSIAAFAARVPIRIYIVWGLYYTSQTGLRKRLLKLFEKIICLVSNLIIPIAHEMVHCIESEKLAKADKCTVMLNGSACGVDFKKFDPDKCRDQGREIRGNLHIPPDGIVIGTVARLTGDKGINELAAAFNQLAQQMDNIFLLIVGNQEEKDRLLPDTEKLIHHHPRIFAVGRQINVPAYYAAMDIFCLPTYREGFGEVNLEAQAMGLPAVSTDVIGPRESIDNGVTGFLVEARNTGALLAPLAKLIKDSELRKKMGNQAKQRVIKMFNRRDMINAVVNHRLMLLGNDNKSA